MSGLTTTTEAMQTFVQKSEQVLVQKDWAEWDAARVGNQREAHDQKTHEDAANAHLMRASSLREESKRLATAAKEHENAARLHTLASEVHGLGNSNSVKMLYSVRANNATNSASALDAYENKIVNYKK